MKDRNNEKKKTLKKYLDNKVKEINVGAMKQKKINE